MGSVWNYYQDRPYSHIDFYLSSPYDTGIVLPIDNPPSTFSHAIEATCPSMPHKMIIIRLWQS